MEVHLIDGTYELFRHFYAVPPARDADGREVAAVRGVMRSVLGMINGGATHIGVATDHVIESFRNELWPGYKTGEGIDPDCSSQFQLLEEALRALGVVVWPMVEFEADDALAAAARDRGARRARCERVIICTPDKDLAQCVRGTRVVQMNRRTRTIRDEAGGRREVRRAAGVDSRLSRARRRYRRRLPGAAGLGRKIRGGGAREIRAPRNDSRRPGDVERQRGGCGGSRPNPRARTRARISLPRSRDIARRHSTVRFGGRAALEGTNTGISHFGSSSGRRSRRHHHHAAADSSRALVRAPCLHRPRHLSESPDQMYTA